MTSVRLTDYSLDREGYPDLYDQCKNYGARKVVLIGGERALKAASPLIRQALQGRDLEVTGEFVYGKECTEANIGKLVGKKEVQDSDLIFAVGGGKAIDTAKITGKRLEKKVFSFPTICSNCSAGTAIAVVYNDDGSFSHYEKDFPAPCHMFICTRVIAEAPEEYLRAGIGDGLSKEPEVRYATRGLDLDPVAGLGLAIAKSCERPFLTYGRKALEDCKNNRASRAVEEVCMDVLVSTGYVSNLTNQDDYYYNSSLAHAFYNASSGVKREGSFLHGQVVSFGVMVLHAYDHNLEGLEKIGKFNKDLGLPTRLSDLNLSYENLDQIAELAKNTTEYKAAANPFTKDKFIQAMVDADKFGQDLAYAGKGSF